jgi:hypothetical protein
MVTAAGQNTLTAEESLPARDTEGRDGIEKNPRRGITLPVFRERAHVSVNEKCLARCSAVLGIDCEQRRACKRSGANRNSFSCDPTERAPDCRPYDTSERSASHGCSAKDEPFSRRLREKERRERAGNVLCWDHTS